jgi:hypothetical protein
MDLRLFARVHGRVGCLIELKDEARELLIIIDWVVALSGVSASENRITSV